MQMLRTGCFHLFGSTLPILKVNTLKKRWTPINKFGRFNMAQVIKGAHACFEGAKLE